MNIKDLSQGFPGLVVVIFGSAAAWLKDPLRPKPRDIDVVWSWKRDGSYFEEDLECRIVVKNIIACWANDLGLCGLPLDLHFQGAYGRPVQIPVPWGLPQAYEVLVSNGVEPEFRGHYGIASAVRAFGHDPEKLREILRAGQPGHRAQEWELQLFPRSHPQWEEHYCNGLDALRSALSHAAPGAWATATVDMPWARFVDALLDRGPSRGGLRVLANRSSGNTARVFTGQSIGTQYGTSESVESAIAAYVVPVPLILNTTILTGLPGDDGDAAYSISRINAEKARAVIAGGFTSAVGHAASAVALTTILGVDVPENRISAAQDIGQRAIVLKMRGRMPEGKILTLVEMEAIGFDLFLLTRAS